MEGAPLQGTPVALLASTFSPPTTCSKSAVNSRTSSPIQPNQASVPPLREVVEANGLIKSSQLNEFSQIGKTLES